MQSDSGKPCIFFDRDGIVNVSPSEEEYYVTSVDRFFIYPEFVECVALARAKGYAVVIVTNQRSIERGLLSEEGLAEIHQHLHDRLSEDGLALDGLYWCPHGGDHPDRKPNPGMLLRAAEDLGLNLAVSWMIGDSERDIDAGIAAGCLVTVMVGHKEPETRATHRVDAMANLPMLLREHLD